MTPKGGAQPKPRVAGDARPLKPVPGEADARPIDRPGKADVLGGRGRPKGANRPVQGDRGGFAFGVYNTPGFGTQVSLFAGNINTPTSFGALPYNYCYGNGWGVGFNYWSNCYNWGNFGYWGWGGNRFVPWYVARWGRGIFNYAWYQARWGFGFGWGYSPACWGGTGFIGVNRAFRRPWYPFYRTYAYYPYCYYDTVAYYPAFSTVYHGTSVVVDYADTADPYVEFTDDVPAAEVAVAPAVPVPEAFHKPFVTDFPDGLSNAELLARGTSWMKDGKYMLSAEAFRRAWLRNSADAFPPLKMSIALLGAGGRYGLAGFALHESLDRDPTTITRHPPLHGDFRDVESLGLALTELKRHVVRNPTDGEARFLLGAALFWSGDSFGARNEFTALQSGEWTSAHVAPFLKAAESRLLDK